MPVIGAGNGLKAVNTPQTTPKKPALPAPAVLPIFIGASDRDTLLSLGFPSPSTVYAAIADGTLVGYKVGRKTVVKTEELIAWMVSTPRTLDNRSAQGRKRPAATTA